MQIVMENSDQIWIDAGYVSGVSNHQCIEIDVSKFIESHKHDLIKPKISCGNFVLNEGKNIIPTRFYCWYTCPDMIRIEEYLFRSKTFFKCALRLHGVSCFRQEIFMWSSGKFVYLIFGVALSLGILSFRLDKVSPSISLFSSLKDTTTIKHRLKFYNIDSYNFNGMFLEFPETKFSFCIYKDNYLNLYNLELPPKGIPIFQEKINLKNNGTGFIGELLRVVPVLNTNFNQLLNLKFLLLTPSVYVIACLFQNSNFCLIRNGKIIKKSFDSYFSRDSKTDLSIILPESLICSILEGDCLKIGINVISSHRNYMFVFSHSLDSSSFNLDLIKTIIPPSSTISLCFHPKFIFAISNSDSIRLNFTSYLSNDTCWKSLGIRDDYELGYEPINFYYNHSSQSSSFDKDFYFSRIFSNEISPKALHRCFQSVVSENEIDQPETDFEQSTLIDYLESRENSIEKIDFHRELSSFCQNLSQLKKFIENSVECAAIQSICDSLFIFLPNAGLKFVHLISQPLSYVNSHMQITFNQDFPNSTLIPSLVAHSKFNDIIESVYQQVLSNEFMSISCILKDVLNCVSNNTIYNFLHQLSHDTIGNVKKFISSIFPSMHPFLQESSALEFDQMSEIQGISLSASLFSNSILKICNYRMKAIIASVLILRAISYGFDRNIFGKELNITQPEIQEAIECLNPIIIFYLMISKLNLMTVSTSNAKKLPLLHFIVDNLICEDHKKESIVIQIEYMISRLLYDPKVYFILINYGYFREYTTIEKYLSVIYSQLKMINGFAYFYYIHQNLIFGNVILNILSSKIELVLSNVSLYMDGFNMKDSNYQMFEQSRYSILSIIDAAFKFLNVEDFDSLFLTIFEGIKVLKNDELLINQINYIRFQHKLGNQVYDGAVSVLNSLSTDQKFLNQSIEMLISLLLETNNSKILISLNYLTIQPMIYKYLLNLIDSYTDYQKYVPLFDILVQFNIHRDLFNEASSVALNAFNCLSLYFPSNFSMFILIEMHRFLSLCYNCLCLVSSPDWRFIHAKNRVETNFNILKTGEIVNLIDLKRLLLVSTAILDLYQLSKNFNVLMINSIDDLLTFLCDEQMFEHALTICISHSLSKTLNTIIKIVIDSCIINENLNIFQLEKTTFFKSNSIIHQDSVSGQYEIWNWFYDVCIKANELDQNVILNAASYFMYKKRTLFSWMIEYLKISSPNKLALLYLAHNFLVESAFIVSNFIEEISLGEEKSLIISFHTVDQVLNGVSERIQYLINKLETSRSEITELQQLLCARNRLQNSLKSYQEISYIQANNIRHQANQID